MPPYSIVAASQNSLWQTVIDPKRKIGAFNKILVSEGLALVALARDPVNKHVFWSDVDAQKISRANLDGSGEQTVIG